MAKQLARCFTCGKYGGEKDVEIGEDGLTKTERQAAERLRLQEDRAYQDFNENYEECGG